MKILSVDQIRAADQWTIENEPIASIDLMERAARTAFNRIQSVFDTSYPVKVFCGPGNNGGDGWVLARLFQESGVECEVYAPASEDKCSADCKSNRKRAEALGIEIHPLDSFRADGKDGLLIDALFGSGLERPLEGEYKDLVQRINRSSQFVISIDIPSGMRADYNPDFRQESRVDANWTLSFQSPKLAFFDPLVGNSVGYFDVLDIGLDQAFIDRQESSFYYLREELARVFLKERSKFSHKGSFGHALLLAGSFGKAGATILAGKSALRSGLGLLSVGCPMTCIDPVQKNFPEAMCIPDLGKRYLEEVPDLSNYHAIGVGPGIGTTKETERFLYALLQTAEIPMVIDADGLNILAENPTWMAFLNNRAILTPHPGEMKRLLGKEAQGLELVTEARLLAMKFGLYIVLKGAHTAICHPNGEVWFNSSGNNGMATAGSGDTLTGIILSLLAQGYSFSHACLLGVHLHGLAGDLFIEEGNPESLMSSDLIELIPKAFRILREE